MELSEKTLAEMKAGVEALARHRGLHGPDKEPLDAKKIYEGIKSVQERMAALKQWEREGKLRIEHVNYGRDYNTLGGQARSLEHRIYHHVTGGPTFEETPEALLCGGYPSELLTANIALAIVGATPPGDRDG